MHCKLVFSLILIDMPGAKAKAHLCGYVIGF